MPAILWHTFGTLRPRKLSPLGVRRCWVSQRPFHLKRTLGAEPTQVFLRFPQEHPRRVTGFRSGWHISAMYSRRRLSRPSGLPATSQSTHARTRWTRSVGLASALQKQPPYSFVHRIPRGATIPRDRLERDGHSDPITENLLDRLDNLRKFVGNLARSPNDAPRRAPI